MYVIIVLYLHNNLLILHTLREKEFVLCKFNTKTIGYFDKSTYMTNIK